MYAHNKEIVRFPFRLKKKTIFNLPYFSSEIYSLSCIYPKRIDIIYEVDNS